MALTLDETLKKFDPIGLAEMDRVKLLKRIDKKYLIHISQLPDFLNFLIKDYQILEHTGKRIMSYQTSYYDTENLDLYRMHLNGRAHRWKVRKRIYSDSDVRFFELKTRTNQGKTEKQRVPDTAVGDLLTTSEKDLVFNELPFSPDELRQIVWTNYKRITLVNKYLNERVTIDTHLYFKHLERESSLDDLVIIELKQDGKLLTPALETLRDLRQKPGSISKYCLGLIATYPGLPANRFKPLLMRIQKLIHQPLIA